MDEAETGRIRPKGYESARDIRRKSEAERLRLKEVYRQQWLLIAQDLIAESKSIRWRGQKKAKQLLAQANGILERYKTGE